MLCLSGFELYSRWVLLKDKDEEKKKIKRCCSLCWKPNSLLSFRYSQIVTKQWHVFIEPLASFSTFENVRNISVTSK